MVTTARQRRWPAVPVLFLLLSCSLVATTWGFVPTAVRSSAGRPLQAVHPSPRLRPLQSASSPSSSSSSRPPLPPDFYAESLLDKVALALFRQLVQREIGYASPKPGYDGLIEEARYYQFKPGVTAEDQQAMVKRCLQTIAGPLVPPVYRTFMAPWFWAPFLTAIFTPPFFKFLVGPNRYDVRDDGQPGGVYAERCRFLEETNCKGLCLNLCKLPTQQFFKETLGLDMTMQPNYDTYECRLSFGIAPAPIEEDETIPKGCISGCNAVAAIKEDGLDRGVVCGK